MKDGFHTCYNIAVLGYKQILYRFKNLYNICLNFVLYYTDIWGRNNSLSIVVYVVSIVVFRVLF